MTRIWANLLLDGFYALSLFVCASKAELDTHARRLLTAQIGAVACFILFPLRFTFARPEASGLDGLLFTALTSHREGQAWVMRRRTQAEMNQLVAAAGFRKIEQRIDEWGIFTVSLAERVGEAG